MNHTGACLFGQRCRQPFDQPFHFGHGFGFGKTILLGPTINLTPEIISGLAIIRQACRLDVGIVQLCQHIDHFEINRSAFGRIAGQHRTVPDRPSIDHAHHIEPATDNAVIGTKPILAGHRKSGFVQTGLHFILAVYSMGAGQQLTKGFAAEHIIA